MILGKFELFEEIGRGGFGIVYRANDTTLDRIVALKILHQQYLSDQKFIESFKREARLMAKVSHPNVVQIYEVGDLDDQIYIAMQFFENGSLERRIRTEGPLPLKDAVRMVNQTARGLEAGHKIGLIHRDVKPANILYNQDGYIAISDFGVAKSILQGSTGTTNSFNQFSGTPYYIPPELWEGKEMPTPAADIYSLACVFYEAITGEVLFEGETYEHVLTRHVLEAPVFSNSFPERLVDTLNIALAKNPSDRYQTMNDLLAALRKSLEQKPSLKVRVEPPKELSDEIEELPKSLAPGEFTFEQLVRRARQRSSPEGRAAKPFIDQQSPSPNDSNNQLADSQPEEKDLVPEAKLEKPVIFPIIAPLPQDSPLIESSDEEKFQIASASGEAEEAESGTLPEQQITSPDQAYSEGESVEEFFTRALDEPLETAETSAPDFPERIIQTEKDADESILEDWLTREPDHAEVEPLEVALTEGDEISPRATKEEPTIEELALSEEVVESILPSPIETSGNDSDSQEGNSAQITAPELPIELVEGTPTIPEPVSEEAEQLLEEGLPTEEVPTADADLSREISDSPRDEVEPLNSQPETVIESVEEVPTMPEAVSEEAELLLEEELPTEEVPTADADLSREISDSPHNEVEPLNSQLEPAIGSVDISLSEPKSITAVEEEHASVEIETPSQEEYGNQTPETPPISPASEESLSESIQKDVKELVEEVPVLLTNREKEDNLAQSIEDRKSLIAYNPATSKYDPNQRAEKEKKKPIALFIAIVGLAVGLFLAFSSQTGKWFRKTPTNTPILTLTLTTTNTSALLLDAPTLASTTTLEPSPTSTLVDASPTASPTATATRTLSPTYPPTARPTDPPAVPTQPPVIPTEPPVVPTDPPVIPTEPPVPTRPPTPVVP